MVGMFIEINLRKTKWLILGTYHPPNQPGHYFFKAVGNALDQYLFKAVGNALDQYLKSYEKFLLLGDFNAEFILSEFLEQYVMRQKILWKIKPALKT